MSAGKSNRMNAILVHTAMRVCFLENKCRYYCSAWPHIMNSLQKGSSIAFCCVRVKIWPTAKRDYQQNIKHVVAVGILT